MVNDRQRKVYEALPHQGEVEQHVWTLNYKRTLSDARAYSIYIFGQDRDYLIERGYVSHRIINRNLKGFVSRISLFSRSPKKLPQKNNS